MDNNNWRATHVGESAMNGTDWRSQLQPDTRQRIINKMWDTLKRHLPIYGQEGIQELKKIAMRLEEKIYTNATSQTDYLRKISLKILTMDTNMLSNSANNGQNPQDLGSQSMQSQFNSQSPPLPVPLPTNFSQSQMTQPQTLENQMNPEVYNPLSPQSRVSNTQQSTINYMDPVEQLVDLYNKIL